MTTPDDRDERLEEARRVARAVRAASGPAPDDGAAQRIADGAWERAGQAAAPERPRGLLTPALRRRAIAAAAAVLVGVGAYALRPTEPVFAVEGEPVQVWRNDGWQETRRVHPGTTVFVADGGSALRGRGALEGEAILPEPGTTFRIEAGDGATRTFVVQILAGAAEVQGGALRLRVSDVDVTPRTAHLAFSAWGGVAGDTATAPPPGFPAVTGGSRAVARFRICMGDATLLQRSTGERLDLGSDEMAAVLPVTDRGRKRFELTRLRAFDPSVGIHIALGNPVVGMHEDLGGAIAVLRDGRDGVTGVSIDSAQLPVALDQIRTAMLAWVSDSPLGLPGMAVEHHVMVLQGAEPGIEDLKDLAYESGETLTEVVSEKNGRRVRVLAHGGGPVEVERDGALRIFESLGAARAADPEAVDLLDGYSDR